MNTVYALIGLPVAGAILIEAVDRVSMHLRMHRRVAKLNLSGNSFCAKCSAAQSTNDNAKQNYIHRAFSFGRMKTVRA